MHFNRISDKIPSLNEVRRFETLRNQVAKSLKEDLDLEAKVILLEPGSLRQSPSGYQRILDRRPG